MANINERVNLGELLKEHPELKSIFLKYGIPVAG
jgi:hypothetical protein